jgi:hypothetical protein
MQTRKTMALRTSLRVVVCAGVFFLLGVPGCVSPPGAAVDGYASAEVETWYDADGDGERGPDESPVPWVTIHMDYERSITDSSGRGRVGVFKPGCARRCWEGESVSVVVPPGYRATTPTEVDLTGAEDTYAFGFQPEAGPEPPALPDEPDWAQAFINRGLDLVDFHYDVGGNRLAVAFDTEDNPDQDALYGDIFEMIRTLRKIEGISVEEVEITNLPSGPIVVCEMSHVEAWMGKIPPAEIVSTYCQTSDLSTIYPTVTQTNESGVTHQSESSALAPPFEGRWCFESESAAFDVQLEQEGDRVHGPFFLLKYCEVDGVLSACRIREGEIAGTVIGDQVEIIMSNPEYNDEGTALLKLGQDSLTWQVKDYPQEYYLPAKFSLMRCGKVSGED